MERPNQAWCSDITFLPMRRGFFYLVAIMDWPTRKVLALIVPHFDRMPARS